MYAARTAANLRPFSYVGVGRPRRLERVGLIKPAHSGLKMNGVKKTSQVFGVIPDDGRLSLQGRPELIYHSKQSKKRVKLPPGKEL